MEITRRSFLKLSGAVGASSALGLNFKPTRAYAAELSKMNRIKTSKQFTTVCAYCSCGCGLISSVDNVTGKIFNIEGDPDNPINEGSLCAKGAGFFDLTEANKHRLRKVQYRAPYSDKWEVKDWDWAMNRIARLVKDTRDKDFVVNNDKGELVNRTERIAHLGSSNIDNEECWLISMSVRAMGLVYIDHQARV
jgi:formate dehydrogenase major subunit